ncbi:MAG: hypothetical protein NVSMB65_00190 [Chloroflexota bacterium]
METSIYAEPRNDAHDTPASVEIPPAFYSDTPLPPPPPTDPHWREWYNREPPRQPRPDTGETASDRATLWWIMGVFGVTVLLHLVAAVLLVAIGHPG